MRERDGLGLSGRAGGEAVRVHGIGEQDAALACRDAFPRGLVVGSAADRNTALEVGDRADLGKAVRIAEFGVGVAREDRLEARLLELHEALVALGDVLDALFHAGPDNSLQIGHVRVITRPVGVCKDCMLAE